MVTTAPPVRRNEVIGALSLATEPRDFLASGDKVVVIGHYDMTQKKTGKPLSSDWVHIFTFAGGKLVAWRELNDSAAFYNAYR